jgi:type IV secretory pathway TraG/TraD family ATPase VirD4
MSFVHTIERWDARHGIPRPMDAPHLNAYHAALHCLLVASQMLVLLACGCASAYLLWLTANNFQVTFEIRLLFITGMLFALFVGCLEATQLLLPYYRIKQRVTYGSALWADASWLKSEGFARDFGSAAHPGELRLGKLTTGHDLVLPAQHTVRHVAILGPPGSGKSATFLMGFLRDWARTGSVIVLDPKGELYEQTASAYRDVYRLDLQDPALSDRWNFLPACKDDSEFAHEVASIIIGLDQTTRKSDSDTFWQVSEIAALTAILLHLPHITDQPTPAMINEFIASRDLDPPPGETVSPMTKEMMQSQDRQAQLYWGTFAKAKRELQGSILTGLAVKCAPFCTPHVKSVTTLTGAQASIIDLKLLRSAGTAIYVVVPEGDASRYSTFLATFFGLAMDSLRKAPVTSDTVPSLFMFDEAGNIPIHGLKEMLGVGRGRKVAVILGYQNISQVYAQYGHDGGDAILGSVGTMLFLPGLDDKTARYASGRVGKTTVLQRTTVDAVGIKYDNERQAEASRDLLDQSELRQMVRHKQAIAIIDTVPPIRFRYPPLSLKQDIKQPRYKGEPQIIDLEEAEQRGRPNPSQSGSPIVDPLTQESNGNHPPVNI